MEHRVNVRILDNPVCSQFQLEKWRSSPPGRHYYGPVNHPHAASWDSRVLEGSKQPGLHGDPTERDRMPVGLPAPSTGKQHKTQVRKQLYDYDFKSE
jgi:hypothetical protein